MRALLIALPIALAACGSKPVEESQTDNVVVENTIGSPKPEEACASMLKGAPQPAGKIIFLPDLEKLRWGSDDRTVKKYAGSIASRTETGDSGLSAYVNGYDDWAEFQFERGRLNHVHERHNNKSRSDAYVPGFLAQLMKLKGEPKIAINSDDECTATWQLGNSLVIASWQDSQYYLEIDYTQNSSKPSFSEQQEQEIWDFYVPLEDRLGKEQALQKTAAHFKLRRDDVFHVIVRGLEKGRPL